MITVDCFCIVYIVFSRLVVRVFHYSAEILLCELIARVSPESDRGWQIVSPGVLASNGSLSAFGI